MEVQVNFSLPELWLLHDVVRHEVHQAEDWIWPPCSLDLNEAIALAIDACQELKLKDYTLSLSYGDCLVIDYCLRSHYKSADGANGKAVLLKVFAARRQLRDAEMGLPPTGDVDEPAYREVMGNARDPSSAYTDGPGDLAGAGA